MKRIVNNIKNIVWLCTPYFRYGKFFLILTILVSLIYGPVGDFIYVRYPEMILSALAESRQFQNILIIAISMSALTWINDMIPSFLYPYFTKKQEKINLKVKKEIYKKVLTVDYKYIDDPEYYETYSWAINEYVKQTYAAKDFLEDFSRYLASIVLLISLIAETSPWILVPLIVQMILHILINLRINKNSIDRKAELNPLDRRLNYFHRLFYLKDYAGDLKATKLGKFILKRYDVTGDEKIGVISKYAIKTAFWSILQETLFVVTEFVLVVYLAKSIVDGNIPEVGMYMTMILAFYRVYSKLHELVQVLQRANEISLNGENIKKFFDFNSVIENQDNPNSIVASKTSYDIKFNNVCFSYDNSAFALKNFHIHIKAGEKVAIVGENGAGKTTLVKLMLRLYDIKSGEILLNDIPIQDYQLESLRSSIGVAFQNTNIYAMSYKENLELYDSLSKEKMTDLTELLGLEAVLEKNNADFESELTREFHKNGIMLSGGEAQKIALARVMAHHFGLLLLDEPSSALDPIAEYKMSEIILDAANKSTTIIVAHRLSMVKNVDKIIVMDNGSILEIGTHEELMAAKGKYYEMFTKQAENYAV